MENKINVLITGARGFIGKNLCEYFSQNGRYKVFSPYHNELELLDTDRVKKYIDYNNINLIIHGANVGGSRKTGYDKLNKDEVVCKNTKMFFNLADTLNGEKRMIFLGSGAEYDLRYYKPKMKEEYFGMHIPEDAYGYSKYICMKYIENSSNIINLRLFGVFGKYEDYNYRFISNVIIKNLFDLPIVINQNVYFDFLYINDLLKIVEYFIHNKGKYKDYNVTPTNSIDLITIANKINQISKKSSEIIINNEGLNNEYSGDNARLLGELGDFKFTTYAESFKELYKY